MPPRIPESQLRAELYAAVHNGTPGDLAFHLDASAGAERVLELGAGAGRLAIPLARAGHLVVAVDVDGAQLEIARQRARRLPIDARERLRWVEADARSLALDETFDHVVMAHSTLYCFADDDELRAVLRSVRAHLVAGGRLVIDAYATDHFHAELDPDADDPLEEIGRVQAGGRVYRVLERSDWDRDAQRFVAHYRHVPVGGGRTIDTAIVHRYVTSTQLVALLRECGFEDVELRGDFVGSPFDPDAEHLVVLAR